MSYTDRFRTDTSYSQPRIPRDARTASIGEMLALIDRACSPTLREPDLALNLQIADIINEKKGSAPREAATAIVNLINNRNTHVAVLAVSVLDVCVKNCGYPFHLQISRKEFLHKLVRRFPEKPPLHYSRIQVLILECIEEWRATICQTSKYREDLGYIRDMHRLMVYKGYVFPDINRDDVAVLNESDVLKTAAELEEEDREAQSAKLQELIRSKSPADLREANRLMSLLSGIRDGKVDYHARVAQDLEKLRRKGNILEEMLSNLTPDNIVTGDDVFSELVTSLRNAYPKLQRVGEEEAEKDPEAKHKIDLLANYINALITKYTLFAKRKYAEAQKIEAHWDPEKFRNGPTRVSSSASAPPPAKSLIDFDDLDVGTSSSVHTAPGATATANSNNDLLGLSFNSRGSEQSLPANLFPVSSSLDPTNELANPSLSNPHPPEQTTASTTMLNSNATGRSLMLSQEKLGIRLQVRCEPGVYMVVAYFSNLSEKLISNLKFEIAPPKSLILNMSPTSGDTLEARRMDGLTQKFTLSGSGDFKLRWRATFRLGLDEASLDGVVRSLND